MLVTNPSPSKQEVAMMLMEVAESIRSEIKILQNDFNEEKRKTKNSEKV